MSIPKKNPESISTRENSPTPTEIIHGFSKLELWRNQWVDGEWQQGDKSQYSPFYCRTPN